MKRSSVNKDLDQALQFFLNESNQERSNHLLEELCESAQQLTDTIIIFKLRVFGGRGISNEQEDAADVRGEIALKLIKRLKEIKSRGDGYSLRNLRGYVATVAYNACDEYLRRKYPRRHSLKKKLRYVLSHQHGLDLWETEEKRWVCGFASWKGSTSSKNAALSIDRVKDTLVVFLKQKFTDGGKSNPAALIAAILDWLDTTIELDDLVDVVSECWEVRDHLPAPIDESVSETAQLVFDPRSTLVETIDHRQTVRLLWDEIRQLPLRQRTALLLSARDSQGTSVAALLPPIAVATLREIAETLEMPAQELASLWTELPLEDSTISARMGLTRQQVINLRKSARERLARRVRRTPREDDSPHR